VVTVLFVLLEFASPSKDVHILWFTYPASTNVLVSLVSFGVSGISPSFLLTVIGAGIARARGWVPEGKFRLGGPRACFNWTGLHWSWCSSSPLSA